MKAEIIAVGTELLLGDIVNTNGAFLARGLASCGVDAHWQTTVGDNRARLLAAFELAFSRADLVITTGGLGPTGDDLTKETAAEFFGRELKRDEEQVSRLIAFFEEHGGKMPQSNYKQADLPEGGIALYNDRGTAPGIILEDYGAPAPGRTIILLPGPPFECEHMFNKAVAPYLAKKSGEIFVSRSLRLIGIGESAAEERVRDLIETQSNPTIAPYAGLGEMRFRVTAKAKDRVQAEELIRPIVDELYKRFPDNIYGGGEETAANSLVALFKRAGYTLALAESCTGGLLAAEITAVPGSSDIFVEGAVTYSNAAKIRRLGVSPDTLERHGAVSEETAGEMARGIAESSGATVGVSITGIAGPGDGTDEKPVGLVFIGICVNSAVKVFKNKFRGDREAVRKRSVAKAMEIILQGVKNA